MTEFALDAIAPGKSALQTVEVSRSFAAVQSSLRAGAERCLNRTVSRRDWSPNPYGGGMYVTSYMKYSGAVSRTATGAELAVEQEMPRQAGLIGNANGVTYVVDIMPSGGGTKLVLYGGKRAYAPLDAAVKQWAIGGRLTCPKMPFEA